MKILLVKPWENSFNWYHSHLLGLVYLASYLRSKGHEVQILDGNFLRLEPEQLLKEVGQTAAQLVGVSCMTHEIPNSRKIFKAVKERRPDCWTILGGPHASGRPVETLEEIPELDFTVAGEGEIPFTQLLIRLAEGQKDYTGIPGLAYRYGQETLFNGPQTTFLDLTTTPQPAVDLYYLPQWFRNHPNSEYRLFASRGCPFKCAYCMRVLGNKVRWRSPEAVVEEWVKAVRYYGARTVFLHDEIFLYENPHTHAILDGVLKEGLQKEAEFHAMTHVKLVNKEILRKAKEAGCSKICIGVESGNNDILKRIHRPYTIREAHRAVQLIKEAGIRPFTFFILGHPGETRRTIFDTIRAAVKINLFEMGMGVMVPYPGTEIYQLALHNEGGYRLKNVDWDAYNRYGGDAMESENLSRQELVFYQVLGFLLFFLLNGKIRGAVNYFSPKIHAVLRVITGRRL